MCVWRRVCACVIVSLSQSACVCVFFVIALLRPTDGVDDDSAIASRTTPTPTPSSKESAASGDDWVKDLELDLTEEEKTMAEKLLNDGEKVCHVHVMSMPCPCHIHGHVHG